MWCMKIKTGYVVHQVCASQGNVAIHEAMWLFMRLCIACV